MPPGGHKRNITVTVQLTRVFGRPPVGLGGIPALGGVVKGRVVAERGPVLLRALIIGGGRRLRWTDRRTDGRLCCEARRRKGLALRAPTW